jgi:hypothetical protein
MKPAGSNSRQSLLIFPYMHDTVMPPQTHGLMATSAKLFEKLTRGPKPDAPDLDPRLNVARNNRWLTINAGPLVERSFKAGSSEAGSSYPASRRRLRQSNPGWQVLSPFNHEWHNRTWLSDSQSNLGTHIHTSTSIRHTYSELRKRKWPNREP